MNEWLKAHSLNYEAISRDEAASLREPLLQTFMSRFRGAEAQGKDPVQEFERQNHYKARPCRRPASPTSCDGRPAVHARHATPRHATPRHATPRHATPRHARPTPLTPHTAHLPHRAPPTPTGGRYWGVCSRCFRSRSSQLAAARHPEFRDPGVPVVVRRRGPAP